MFSLHEKDYEHGHGRGHFLALLCFKGNTLDQIKALLFEANHSKLKRMILLLDSRCFLREYFETKIAFYIDSRTDANIR
jgi:hypothetical protein